MMHSIEPLRDQLTAAEAELRAHLASWAYALAMGSGRHGGADHPTHRATRARAEFLAGRCADLRARLAEHHV